MIRKTATLGTFPFGRLSVARPMSITVPDAPTRPAMVIPNTGAGGPQRLGPTIFGRSYPYRLRPKFAANAGKAILTFTTINGVIGGSIRLDVRRPILAGLEFSLRGISCEDLNFRLGALPDFPLLAGSMVSVRIGETAVPQYLGILDYPQTERAIDNPDEPYEFEARGLASLLKEMTLPEGVSWPVNTAPGRVVADIVNTYVAPRSPIRYSAGRIDATLGTPLAGDYQPGRISIDKIIENMAGLSGASGADWGVDGSGELYFVAKNQETQITTFVGANSGSLKPTENIQAVINSYTMLREQQNGTSQSGWVVSDIFTDASSIARYGLREYPNGYKIAGYLTDTDIAILADNLLEQTKEIKHSATQTDAPVVVADDVYRHGIYRFFMPLAQYRGEVERCDTVTGWSKTGSGDLAIALDTDTLATGSGAIRFDWHTGADDSYYQKDTDVRGRVVRFTIYVYCDTVGTFAEFGFGRSAFTENMFDLPVRLASQWHPVQLDLPAPFPRDIRKIGFRVKDASGLARTLRIDAISAELIGSQRYDFELIRQKISVSGDTGAIKADREFGPQPLRNEDYIATMRDEMKFLTSVGVQKI